MAGSGTDSGGPKTDAEGTEETDTVVGAPARLSPKDSAEIAIGERVGRFVVLEEIGRGNMGRVLRAYDDKLHREVALKEVLAESLGTLGSSRLVAEARAMARLSHPNVVAVYDVEESFDAASLQRKVVVVMEYVPGTTLRTWQRDELRPWKQVLSRYVAAGDGLAAAHAAGLLHRDFKPANVLIDDGDGRVEVVKVTDFGLAKLGQDPSLDGPSRVTHDRDPSMTLEGLVSGTPRYMAPEQHRGAELEASADQFAFCVSLWEGLCGEPPYAGADLAAAKEQGPPAWSGSAVPGVIVDAIRRGLSPDPADRWPSMDALLGALRHDPTRRRMTWAAVTGAAGVFALSALQWRSSAAQRDQQCTGARAEIEAVWSARRDAVRSAMVRVGGAFAQDAWDQTEADLDTYATRWARQHHDACAATTLRGEQSAEVMDRRMRCLQQAKTDLDASVQTLARADMDTVRNAHQVVAALPNLERCADLDALDADVAPPPDADADAVEAARAELASARAELWAGHFSRARDLVDAVQPRVDAIEYGPLRNEANLVGGNVLVELGDYDPAEQRLLDALRGALTWHQLDLAREVAIDMMDLVGARMSEPAIGLRYRELAEGLAGDEPLPLAHIATTVGTLLSDQGKHQEALALQQRALKLRLETLGPEHRLVAASRINIANALKDMGEYADGEAELRTALALNERLLGPEHPIVATTHANLANNLDRQGRAEDAEVEHRAAMELLERALGPDHVDLAQARGNLAVSLHGQGRREAAEREFRAALAILREQLGPEHHLTLNSRANLATNLRAQGKLEEAEAELREVLEIRTLKLGPEHTAVGDCYNNLANVVLAQGDVEQAEAHYRRALEIWRNALGPAHPDVIVAQTNLAHSLASRDAYDEARPLAEEAWSNAQREDLGPRIRADAAILLAHTVREREETRAIELARVALKAYREAGPTEADNAAQVESTLQTWTQGP